MGKKNTIGGKGYKKKKACSAEFDVVLPHVINYYKKK